MLVGLRQSLARPYEKPAPVVGSGLFAVCCLGRTEVTGHDLCSIPHVLPQPQGKSHSVPGEGGSY